MNVAASNPPASPIETYTNLPVMTRSPWPTPEQMKWLDARLPAFVEAQHNKTTSSTFFPEVQKAWQESFPTPEPTDKDIEEAKGNRDAAVAKNYKFWEKVTILLFYYNDLLSCTASSVYFIGFITTRAVRHPVRDRAASLSFRPSQSYFNLGKHTKNTTPRSSSPLSTALGKRTRPVSLSGQSPRSRVSFSRMKRFRISLRLKRRKCVRKLKCTV